MKIKTITQNKKAVSEIVSYVLLIVIAISISASVYAWLKFYLPSSQESETCGQDYALAIKDYSCKDKTMSLTLENKGLFNITGFFIKVGDEDKTPTNVPDLVGNGVITPPQNNRFYFIEPLKPGDFLEVEFDYTIMREIKRMQIQPFILTSKLKKVILCERIIDRTLSDCN